MKTTSRRIVPALLAAVLMNFGAGLLMSQTPAVLTEMSFQKDGARLNILLKIEGTYAAEASLLASPPRLVVDVTPISETRVLSFTKIGEMGVLSVRMERPGPEKVQVTFDLGPNVPAYGITLGADGVKISFWFEGNVPAEAKPAVQTAPAAPAAPTSAEPSAPKRSSYFIAGRAGLSFYPGAGLTVTKSMSLYGETATLEQSYSFGTVPAFELQFGRYFGRTKVGIGAAYSTLKQPGTYTGSFPHPFLPSTPRTVTFASGDLNNTLLEFSVFALFSLMRTDKITLAAGPMIGLNLGEMQSLVDFDFSEEAPYDDEHVTISNPVYTTDKFTEFSIGVVLNLEYRLNEGLSLLFDVRAVYLNPKNATLGKRADLIHLQPVVGIQYNF